MPLAASPTILLRNLATLPSHQPPCQPFVYTHTQRYCFPRIKFSVFLHRCRHDRTQSSTLFLCSWHARVTHGKQMDWGGGKSAFSLSLYFSVCTSLRGLNEITVIQLDQRGEEIQMLFSSSPAGVSTSLSPLYPLWIVSPSLPSLFPSLLLIYVHNKKKKSRIESTFQSIQSQFNVEQSISV